MRKLAGLLPTPNILKRLRGVDRDLTWVDLIALAGIFWVARYWLSAQFGLYEDDLTRIPGALIKTGPEFVDLIVSQMTEFWTNRPFHDIFIKLLARLGWQIGGLWGMYWVGYLATLVNLGLFYWLLRRLGSRWFGLVGGLAYALFSADTTQAYLTLSLGLQHALTLLLLAFHAYLSDRRWLAYLLAAPIILFAYETPYLVFCAAPLLLQKPWNWRRIGEIGLHAVILLAIMFFSSWFRVQAGLGVDREAVLAVMLRNILNGPWLALKSYLSAPRYAFRFWSYEMLKGMLLTFPVFLLLLWGLRAETNARWRDWVRLNFSESQKTYLRLAFAGLVMLIAAYPLTLTTTVFETIGRETRAHSAGVVGAALLIASGVMLVLQLSRLRIWSNLLAIGLSVIFAGLIGYGLRIQHEYKHAWQFQQEFWQALMPLIEDAGPQTTILVDGRGLEDTWQIGANTWNMPRILDQIYLFPEDGQDPPRVYRLRPGQTDHLVNAQGEFVLNAVTVIAPPDFYRQVPSQQVIWIQTAAGEVLRQESFVDIQGTAYILKPRAAFNLSALPRGPLYPLLIEVP